MPKKTPIKKRSDRTLKKIKNESYLSPEKRQKIYKLLCAHFGSGKIDKELNKCMNVKERNNVLLNHKRLMEMEIEQEKRDVDEYIKTIDDEYKKIGRPKSVFSWKEMQYLISLQCSDDEIAGFFGVCKSTLKVRIKDEFGISWSEYYERYSQGAKVSLRRKQFDVALNGDVSMLKFLGKNILGQKEKMDFDGKVQVNSFVDLMNNLEAELNEDGTLKGDEDGNNKEDS